MLLLASTSDKLQLVTASAVAIDVHASWTDLVTATGVVTPGRTNSKPTTATTTDIVAAPAAGTIRNVKTLHIENIHASSSNLVTLQHTDGTLVVTIESVTLAAGESLSYVEGLGRTIHDAAGLPKVNPATIAGNLTVAKVGTAVTNATTTAAKITALDLVAGVGTFVFEYWISYLSDTVTTGIKFGCNHTGTVTFFVYNMSGVTADITTNTALMDQDVLLTTGATMSAWAARAKSTTAPMITSGVDTISVDTLMKIEGLMVVTASGNLELYHASEVATTTTVRAGSCVRLTKVG